MMQRLVTTKTVVCSVLTMGIFFSANTAVSAQAITYSAAECQQIATDCYAYYAQYGFESPVACYDSVTAGVECESETGPTTPFGGGGSGSGGDQGGPRNSCNGRIGCGPSVSP